MNNIKLNDTIQFNGQRYLDVYFQDQYTVKINIHNGVIEEGDYYTYQSDDKIDFVNVGNYYDFSVSSVPNRYYIGVNITGVKITKYNNTIIVSFINNGKLDDIVEDILNGVELIK